MGDEYKEYAVFQPNGVVKVRRNILSGNNHTSHRPKGTTLFIAWQCNLMTGMLGTWKSREKNPINGERFTFHRPLYTFLCPVLPDF